MLFVFQTRWSECCSAAAHQRDSDEVAPVSGTVQHDEVEESNKATVLFYISLHLFFENDGLIFFFFFFWPFSWLQLMNAQPEKPFIRNKAAQVFALTFVMEYLTLWPKFFFDVLSLVGLNPHGVDIYLRTLMAIDAEVVDRDILHTPEARYALTSDPNPQRNDVHRTGYGKFTKCHVTFFQYFWSIEEFCVVF